MSTQLPPNVFKVTPINDDRSNVQRGMMIVSNTDLTYTNSRTQEQLEWPLKYLRKYGCDGDVFSFEAGRKCPGGEGLYAFRTKKASELFELVARNINQGNLQPPSDLSPVTLEATRSLISGIGGRSPEVSQVMEMSSIRSPVPIGPVVTITSEAAAAPPPLPEPRVVVTKPYQDLQFDKEPGLYPAPPSSSGASKYATIDFDETEQLNGRRRNGTAPTSVKPVKSGRKRSQTSSSSGTKGPRKPSQSSIDSHSSMTESTRDPITSPNSSIVLPGAQNYENIVMGEQGGLQVVDAPPQSNYQNVQAAIAQDQPNYQNITVGHEVPSLVLSSTPQNGLASYANLTLGPASPKPTELLSIPLTHTVSVSVSGSAYGSYAELDLSASLSMPTSPHGPNGTPHPQLTPIAELGTAGANVEGGKGTAEGATGEAAVAGRPRDKEEVSYGSLDFGAMKELEKMQKERERLKQAGGEPMSRDKDRANSTQNHKKQK